MLLQPNGWYLTEHESVGVDHRPDVEREVEGGRQAARNLPGDEHHDKDGPVSGEPLDLAGHHAVPVRSSLETTPPASDRGAETLIEKSEREDNAAGDLSERPDSTCNGRRVSVSRIAKARSAEHRAVRVRTPERLATVAERVSGRAAASWGSRPSIGKPQVDANYFEQLLCDSTRLFVAESSMQNK